MSMDRLALFLLDLIMGHTDWPGDENREVTPEELERWFKGLASERSGQHIGEMHRWIQWSFRNGDTVRWGSEQILEGDVTPEKLEGIAQRIRYVVVLEIYEKIRQALGAAQKKP